MTTDFIETALNTKAIYNCHTRAEQREIWRRKLQEGLKDEQCDVGHLKSHNERTVFWKDTISRYNNWELNQASHKSDLKFLFFSMHYVAYFDGLLGGTGIAKGAIETQTYY